MRNGDIPAHEALRPEVPEEGLKLGWRHVKSFVGAGEAVLPDPEVVDQRRAGMLDWVTDNESFGHQAS
jgi:hypothetical protein